MNTNLPNFFFFLPNMFEAPNVISVNTVTHIFRPGLNFSNIAYQNIDFYNLIYIITK